MLRNRTLLAISLTVCAAYIGIGMVGPVRVLYAQSRGASLAIIGAMASAYLISNFVFQYPVGWLADRWGRKEVMIVGLVAQAALSLIYLFISDPILFIILRFIEGIAAATLLPSARALIIDVIPAEKQGEAYGIFNAFFNAGFLLGPGIGGLLASTGYASAFIGAALCRLLAIVIVIFTVHPVRRSVTTVHKAETEKTISYRALFTLPLIGAYFLAFGDYLYLGFDLTLMPLWMHDHLGASVAVIGLAYIMWAIPNTVLSPITGRLADRASRSLLILVFGLIQVPIYISYGIANSIILVIALFTVHGAVYAFIQPAVDAHVANSSASGVRARVQGLFTTVGLMGAFVGASGFSPLYALNFRFPLFAMGIAFGICVLVGGSMIRIAEVRKRKAVEPTHV
ncbi:MAG: MFS transporter [Ktedonobacteraceae bacterium]